MNTWLIEILRGARGLLRRPGFLGTAAVTLALGIGACVAVFALVDAVLLAPLPYPQADRLVVLGFKGNTHPWSTISPQQYQLLDGLPGVERLGAKFAPKDVNVAGGGEPDLVSAWPVDAGLLTTLGVAPALGRSFSAEEDRPNGPRAAILGYAFWQRHFNGDAGVIGRSVLIDGVATPVVGVLPATFRLDGAPDVLLPLALGAGSRDSATNLLVLARLAPGISRDAASAMFVARLQAHSGELGFANMNWRPQFSATSLAQNLGATAKPVLLLFFACALCVLLLVAVFGFAIPSQQARRTVEQLIRTGKAQHPVIGVLLDRSYVGEGVKVSPQAQGGQPPVTPGGPAEEAGIKPGDVITAFEGRPVAEPDELVVAIRARAPGDQVKLTVRTGGRERTVTMTLQAAVD